MTIEIRNPEDKKIIQTKLESGEFGSIEDLIHSALVALPSTTQLYGRSALGLTPVERAAAFRRWAESHDDDVVLPDEAMDRASYYGERG